MEKKKKKSPHCSYIVPVAPELLGPQFGVWQPPTSVLQLAGPLQTPSDGQTTLAVERCGCEASPRGCPPCG